MAGQIFGVFSVKSLVEDSEYRMDKYDQGGGLFNLHVADGDLNRHLPALLFIEEVEPSRLRLLSYAGLYLSDPERYSDLKKFYEEYCGVIERADEDVLRN